MSDGARSGTPAWVKITVGLGVVVAALVAVLLGYKTAVGVLAVATLLMGSELAVYGLLGEDENQGELPR